MKKFIKENKLIIVSIIIFTTIAIALGGVVITRFSNNSQKATKTELDPTYKGVEESKPQVKKSLSLEIGSELPKIQDYFNNPELITSEANIKYYYNDIEVSDASLANFKDNKQYLKSVNDYKIVITIDNKKYNSSLIVVDTTPPEVSLKDVSITKGDSYSVKDFLSSYQDNSGSSSYTISFKSDEYSKINKVGNHSVTVTICDIYKNCVDKTATLVINEFVLKVTKTIEQEVVINTEEIKYGVKKITKAKITYDVYNDGSKKEVSRGTETTTIDQSTYDGTVKEMKEEATNTYDSLASSRDTILSITNQYRTEKNVTGLVADRTLSIMATIRAMEMAYSGKFSHTRPDGREWSTLWTDYSGSIPGGVVIGENLAYNYSSDEAACEGWRNSQGHYENMINPIFTKIGIGKFTFNGKTYWVQLLQS
jgi:uncharacterized protein YkwD